MEGGRCILLFIQTTFLLGVGLALRNTGCHQRLTERPSTSRTLADDNCRGLFTNGSTFQAAHVRYVDFCGDGRGDIQRDSDDGSATPMSDDQYHAELRQLVNILDGTSRRLRRMLIRYVNNNMILCDTIPHLAWARLPQGLVLSRRTIRRQSYFNGLNLIKQTARQIASSLPYLRQIVEDAQEYEQVINSWVSRAAQELLNDVTHILCSIQIISAKDEIQEAVAHGLNIEETVCRFRRDYIVYNTLIAYLRSVSSKLQSDIDEYSERSE